MLIENAIFTFGVFFYLPINNDPRAQIDSFIYIERNYTMAAAVFYALVAG
jgi:hypothetical protein